jgi:hypothetical protein
MFKIIGVAVVLALTGGVAHGQAAVDAPPVEPVSEAAPAQVAAIDPNAPLPTGDTVVAQCTTMATDLSIADPEAGICISAAQTYIAALVAAPAPLATDGSASARDAALNALVAEIAQLTQDNVCDKRDEELAAAVDAAADAAEAEETRTTLAEISRTIREVCTDGTTAAIDDGSPADVGII